MEQLMFITPMKPLDGIGGNIIEKEASLPEQGGSLFQDIFHQVVGQVEDTQKDVEEKQYLLATGQIDDMHTLPIAEAKAALSLDVMIAMRNKAMEAYSELMRISI